MKIVSIVSRMFLIGWSIGLGTRFVYGYLNGTLYYHLVWMPDFFLDWLGLVVLGAMNYIIISYEIYASLKSTRRTDEAKS